MPPTLCYTWERATRNSPLTPRMVASSRPNLTSTCSDRLLSSSPSRQWSSRPSLTTLKDIRSGSCHRHATRLSSVSCTSQPRTAPLTSKRSRRTNKLRERSSLRSWRRGRTSGSPSTRLRSSLTSCTISPTTRMPPTTSERTRPASLCSRMAWSAPETDSMEWRATAHLRISQSLPLRRK